MQPCPDCRMWFATGELLAEHSVTHRPQEAPMTRPVCLNPRCAICCGDSPNEHDRPVPPDPRDATIARLTRLNAEQAGEMERLTRDLAGAEQTIDAVRAALLTATRERDEARANFLRCAEAIGVVYEADGCASSPGPIETVEQYIRGAHQQAMEHIDCVHRYEEVEAMRGVVEAARDVREDLNRFLDRGLEVPPEMVENCEHTLDQALAALDAARGGSDE
jgi:hypothetical protein